MPNSSQPTRKKARVLQHLVAQLPEELDLKKGEEVIVTGEAEDGWLWGECNGRSGIFPSGFVTFINEETPEVLLPLEISVPPPAAEPCTPFYLAPKVDDRFNGRPYGITSYDFYGQHADELSLYAGQTVYLIRHVNNEWIEGETDSGQKGIFPTSFVEIVIDCGRPEPDSSTKNIDLLLDFDPLAVNENHSTTHLSTNETNNRLSGNIKEPTWEVQDAHTSLDSFIARNLNLLDLTSSKQASEKQRPASWSQTLTKLQIEYSTQPKHNKLPAIPPRRQETQSVSQAIHHTPALSVEKAEPDIGNEPSTRFISNEPCGSISSGTSDCGALRKSYTRPAPPPPPADSPNLGLSRQNSTDSVGSYCQPLRPAPLIPLDGKCLFFSM